MYLNFRKTENGENYMTANFVRTSLSVSSGVRMGTPIRLHWAEM